MYTRFESAIYGAFVGGIVGVIAVALILVYQDDNQQLTGAFLWMVLGAFWGLVLGALFNTQPRPSTGLVIGTIAGALTIGGPGAITGPIAGTIIGLLAEYLLSPNSLAVRRPRIYNGVNTLFGWKGGVGLILILLSLFVLNGWQTCGWLDVAFKHSGCLGQLNEAYGNSIAFDPKGQLLVITDSNYTSLFQVNDHKLLMERGFQARIGDTVFTPDGAAVAINYGEVIEILETANWEPVTKFNSELTYVYSLEFSSDAKSLAAGAPWGVRIWQVADGSVLHDLVVDRPIQDLAFSPDGTTLTGAAGIFVAVWDVVSDELLYKLKGHRDLVSEVTFTPDGAVLISRDIKGRIIMWSMDTGALLHDWQGHYGVMNSIIFNTDGTTMILGFSDGTVELRRTNDGTLLSTQKYDMADLNAFVLTDNGLKLATLNYGLLRLWEIQSPGDERQ